MAIARKNTKVNTVINENIALAKKIAETNITRKGEETMTTKNATAKTVNTVANVKGEETMTTKKATTTKNDVIVVTINENTKLQGYEIRFSRIPEQGDTEGWNAFNPVKAILTRKPKFGFYPTLANAWIQKKENVSDKRLEAFIAKAEEAGYKVKRTVDGKGRRGRPATKKVETKPAKAKAEPKAEAKAETPKVNEKAMIDCLTAMGYTITKTEEKPKKATTKAKATSKSKSNKKTTKKASKPTKTATEEDALTLF